MAIYHFSAKVSKHSKAKHDYICRENKYANQEDKKRESWSVNLPSFAQNDSSLFWSEADKNERKNGVRAREIEVALPVELTHVQQKKLIDKFVKDITSACTDQPLPATIAIHQGKGKNPHFHIMFSERPTSDSLTAKDFFSRKNPKIKEWGGSKRKNTLEVFREKWEERLNQTLKMKDDWVSCKSLKDQEIDREPTKHVGPAQRLGLSKHQKKRSEANRSIKKNNAIEEAKTVDFSEKLDDLLVKKDRLSAKAKKPVKPIKSGIEKKIKQEINVIEQEAFTKKREQDFLFERTEEPGFFDLFLDFFGIETQKMNEIRQRFLAKTEAEKAYKEAKLLQASAKTEAFAEVKKQFDQFNYDVEVFNKAKALINSYDAKIRAIEEKIELINEDKDPQDPPVTGTGTKTEAETETETSFGLMQ